MTFGWGDPVDSTMQDRIEEKLRDLLLERTELDGLKVIFRGEPGAVPTKLHPFAVVFLELEADANADGYGAATGVRHYRYDGYVSIDVVHKDAAGLLPGPDRRSDVGSYLMSKSLIQAARQAIMDWAGPFGTLEGTPVVSADTRERTVEVITENIRNGLISRDENNYTNRASFDFHVMTTRNFF
jgi:hypothetical protein